MELTSTAKTTARGSGSRGRWRCSRARRTSPPRGPTGGRCSRGAGRRAGGPAHARGSSAERHVRSCIPHIQPRVGKSSATVPRALFGPRAHARRPVQLAVPRPLPLHRAPRGLPTSHGARGAAAADRSAGPHPPQGALRPPGPRRPACGGGRHTEAQNQQNLRSIVDTSQRGVFNVHTCSVVRSGRVDGMGACDPHPPDPARPNGARTDPGGRDWD
jgi:hypothetical protein